MRNRNHEARIELLAVALSTPVLLWGFIAPFLREWTLASQGSILIQEIVGWIALPSMSLLALYKFCRVSPMDYGLHFSRRGVVSWKYLSICLFVTVAYLTFVPVRIGLLLLLGTSSESNYYFDLLSGDRFRFAIAFYFAASAAVVEELFFRGVLHRLIVQRTGTGSKRSAFSFVVGSALLFAANHWWQGPTQVLATLYLGLISAAIYSQLRDIRPFIVGHLILNLAVYLPR